MSSTNESVKTQSEGVRLRIRVDDTNMPVRDFGNYLTFVDRIYGRATPSGLASYAQKRQEYITITEVQLGSLELIIEEILKNSPYIVTVFIILKYLPDLIKAFGETYQAVQEGRLAKEKVNEIRNRLGNEPVCSDLTEEHWDNLINNVVIIFKNEANNLVIPERFTEDHVYSVILESD